MEYFTNKKIEMAAKALNKSTLYDVMCIDFFWGGGALRPNAGHGLLILEVSRSHTTHHNR
jgi:hypothetical protein